MRRIISLVAILFCSTIAWGAKVNPNPFKIISIEFDESTPELGRPLQLTVKWELADGYHAYVEQFAIKSVQPLDAPTKLQDIRKVKDFFDKTSNQKRQGVEGSGIISAQVLLPKSLPQGAYVGELEITYQACASDHCLLPKTVRAQYQIFMKAPQSVKILGLAVAVDDWRIWVAVFIAGVLTSLTPCIFPLIPITLAVLGARKEHGRKRDGLALSLSYVLGIALTYAILGVIAALTGSLFGSFLGHPLVVAALAVLFIGLGLSMLGWFSVETPAYLTNKLLLKKTKGGLFGAFLAGTVAGVVASPCVGPVLAALLTYVAQTQNVVQGFALLFVFAFGLGQLFLALGTFSRLQKKIPRSGPWMEAVKWIFALSFFGLAAFYIRPYLSLDNLWRLCAGLFVLSFINPDRVAAWRKKPNLLRVRTVMGVLAVIGAATILTVGNPNRVWPGSPVVVEKSHGPWQPFSHEKLAAANAAGQAVIVDFYADWCVACKELETKTFNHPDVEARMKGVMLLRYDATQTTPDFELLQKRYEIIGLPYVIFIDGQGQWQRDLTVTGFEDASAFLKRLDRFLPSELH